MKSVRMIVTGLGAVAVLGLGVVSFAPSAEAQKKKMACTDVTGVSIGATKKEAERNAKAEASASANAFFGTSKLKVKPYSVACGAKLLVIECTAATTACKR